MTWDLSIFYSAVSFAMNWAATPFLAFLGICAAAFILRKAIGAFK